MPIESLAWKKKAQGGTGQAILLVHGVGKVHTGDYGYLKSALEKVLGDKFGDFALYTLYYDSLNEYLAEKIRAKDYTSKAAGALAKIMGAPDSQVPSQLSDGVASFAGDVIWPILSLSARQAIQALYLAQLEGMVEDGGKAGFPTHRQRISIICHSEGCFHTYETLHAAAANPKHRLSPAGDGVVLENVIFMASPVQLIRTVAGGLADEIPAGLACLKGDALACPYSLTLSGAKVFSAKRWISITGDLDPVGGHFFHKKGAWAYMDVKAPDGFPGQISRINIQDFLGVDSVEDLRSLLMEVSATLALGRIPAKNPHSWEDYILRNATELTGWLS